MKVRISKKPSAIYGPLMLLIVAASTIQYGIYRSLPIFQGSIALSLMFVLLHLNVGNVKLRKSATGDKLVLGLASAFIIVSVLTSISHGTFVAFLTFTFYGLAVQICYLLGRNQSPEQFKKTCVWISILFFGIVAMGLLKSGFSVYRYEGIFDNPNGLGRFAAGTVLFGVTVLRMKRSEGGKILQSSLSLLIFLSVVLLLSSNSRGSILSLISGLLFISLTVFWPTRQLKLRRRSLRIFFFTVVGIASILAFATRIGAIEQVIRKTEVTISQGDLSQHRFDRWREGYEHVSLFGHQNYLEALSLPDVHNNYLNVLLNFGFFTVIVFTFMFLTILVCSTWMALKGPPILASSTAAFCIFFMIYSLFETAGAIFVVWLIPWFFGQSVTIFLNDCTLRRTFAPPT